MGSVHCLLMGVALLLALSLAALLLFVLWRRVAGLVGTWCARRSKER